MNGIFTTSSQRSNNINRPKESVETAGSLAMNTFHSLFEVNNYDMFTTDNPFAVDYSLYSDYSDGNVYSGFLSSFSSAVSVISSNFSDSGCSDFSGFTGGGDCGFSGCSSGGFTSFC